MERAARLLRNSKQSAKLLTDDDIARALWPAAVGKAIAAHTVRVKLVRATLVVEVEDGIWQRQLFPMTRQILVRLHQVMGCALVGDIEFRVAIPRRQPVRVERPGTQNGPPAASDDESDRIQDPVLKKVYRLSRKKAIA